MQTAETSANAVAGTRDGFVHAEPLNVCKRIGSTVYEIEVYVKNPTRYTGESVEDKIMRLIRNDLNLAASHVKMNMPQTGRLSERSSA
jgi:hypothetical protein